MGPRVWGREYGAEGMGPRVWGRGYGAESMGPRVWGRGYGSADQGQRNGCARIRMNRIQGSKPLPAHGPSDRCPPPVTLPTVARRPSPAAPRPLPVARCPSPVALRPPPLSRCPSPSAPRPSPATCLPPPLSHRPSPVAPRPSRPLYRATARTTLASLSHFFSASTERDLRCGRGSMKMDSAHRIPDLGTSCKAGPRARSHNKRLLHTAGEKKASASNAPLARRERAMLPLLARFSSRIASSLRAAPPRHRQGALGGRSPCQPRSPHCDPHVPEQLGVGVLETGLFEDGARLGDGAGLLLQPRGQDPQRHRRGTVLELTRAHTGKAGKTTPAPLTSALVVFCFAQEDGHGPLRCRARGRGRCRRPTPRSGR